MDLEIGMKYRIFCFLSRFHWLYVFTEKNTLWPSSFHNALWSFYEYRVEHSIPASLGKEEGCNVKATVCPFPSLRKTLRCFLQKPYSFLKSSLKSTTLQKTEVVYMKRVNHVNITDHLSIF